jgi:hypothetical protein
MIQRTMPALRAGAVVALLLALTACGGGIENGNNSDRSMKALLPITSGVQGAQAASAAVHAGSGTATVGVKLANLAGQAVMVADTLPGIGFIPLTFNCGNLTPILFGRPTIPDSVTIVRDRATGATTASFNSCRIGATMTQGDVTLSGGAPRVFTLGSAAAPVTVTDFAGPVSDVIDRVFTAAATLSFTKGIAADTLVVTGPIDVTDSVRHSHDRFDLTNVSITVAKSTALIGADAFDVSTLTLNGAVTRTAFVSDIDPAVRFTESDTFADLAVVLKTPAAGSLATADFLSVNGQISIVAQPAGSCIDGTFLITTNTDVQIDKATGMISAGQVTVNTAASATFNVDGGVSVSIGGAAPAAFTRPEVTALCVLAA